MGNLDITTLAYTAGFVDGEGAITIERVKARSIKGAVNDHYRIRVRIANVHREPLQMIHNEWGGYFYLCKRKIPKHRRAWTLSLLSRDALAFLKSIEPYLILKMDVAKLAIELGEDHIRQRFCRQRQISPESQSRRADIYTIAKALNKRGL